jgi:hypothetical protein
MEAKQLFFSSDLRRALLALREEGAVSIFVSAEEALVAVSSGKNRFEAGSMLRRLPPEDRVKRMFDDLAASLETLSLLRRVLG